MDILIRSANFVHDDQSVSDLFERDLHLWLSKKKEKAKLQEILNALDELRGKLTGVDQHPSYPSYGHRQAEHVSGVLVALISEQVRCGKAQPQQINEVYFNLIMSFMRHGVGTLHMEMISLCSHDDQLKFDIYMKSLQGEKLEKFASAFCTAIIKRENTKDREFYEQYKNYYTKFMDSFFEKSQLAPYRQIFMNHAVHLYLEYGHLDAQSHEQIHKTSSYILGYFYDQTEEGNTNNTSMILVAANNSNTTGLIQALADNTNTTNMIQALAAAVGRPGFPQTHSLLESCSEMLKRLISRALKQRIDEAFCHSVFDLLGAIAKCESKDEKSLFEFLSLAVQLLRYQEETNISDNSLLFKESAPRYKSLILTMDMKFLIHTTFAEDVLHFLKMTFANNKKLMAVWIDLIAPLLSRPCENCYSACFEVLRTKDITWKDHTETANEIFDTISSINVQQLNHETDAKRFITKYSLCLRTLLDDFKRSRIVENFGEKVLTFSLNILEMKIMDLFKIAYQLSLSIKINVKAKMPLTLKVLERLKNLLSDDDLSWDSSGILSSTIQNMFRTILSEVRDGGIFTEDAMKLMVTICVVCLKHEGLEPGENKISSYYSIAIEILRKLIIWLGSTRRMKLAAPLVPLVIQKYDEDEYETLAPHNSSILLDFGQHGPSALAPYLDQLLKIFINKEEHSFLVAIYQAYSLNPKPLKEHFETLLNTLLTSGEQQVTVWLAKIFHSATKMQPELFSEKNMRDILELAKVDNNCQADLLLAAQEFSKRKPDKMTKNIDLLFDDKGWDPRFLPWINDMVCTLTVFDKNLGQKSVDYLLQNVKKGLKDLNKPAVYSALNAIQMIGFKYKTVLKPRQSEIEALQITDPECQIYKQNILDMIDGKTSGKVTKELQVQQAALQELIDKVDEVEGVVFEVKDQIGRQEEKIDKVQDNVTWQEHLLVDVKGTVEETVLKVEEIDNKTLSHAPYWSRDICKLLNPPVEHDWRLLSTRLGYSNNDIRGWAQQADPCMAMLNEWYATHKTSESTLAILTHLQEMNRIDAAIIVENAMKNAEAVVEDEEFEYASPPPVFISYQWGHQEEVKLLKKHLEMAGYECWMDIGQMGGGDKLFEKIDNGIRAAKVVISCITNKYTKSPNCNREVNLSLGLHKPIIPLLLEQCPWPPPGSMGPIFSESLFIRFFQRKGEETTDQRYWSEPKFLELLMQLNMNGLSPDEGKIEAVYRNWWIPIENEIKIDKNKTRNGGQTQRQNENSKMGKEQSKSPEVFISYQWGKQKDIIKLYERLTSMGFNCWLDIKQMGGGDSLYDKIDRGIRGSKVVLSCVTQKYALSANCRREVSLADALKKPLLPLLLEKMTWPPAGPMSMVMTQLLYIRFTEDTVQNTWTGPQFDELIAQINSHVTPMSDNDKEMNDAKQSRPVVSSPTQVVSTRVSGGEEKSLKSQPLGESRQATIPRGKDIPPTASSETPAQKSKSCSVL